MGQYCYNLATSKSHSIWTKSTFPSYILWKFNFGQVIWNNIRFIEHNKLECIWNINMGWGCKHIRIMKISKNPTPPPPNRKKLWLLGCMLIHLIGCVEVIFQIVLVNPLLPPTNVFSPLIRKEKKKKNAQKVKTF